MSSFEEQFGLFDEPEEKGMEIFILKQQNEELAAANIKPLVQIQGMKKCSNCNNVKWYNNGEDFYKIFCRI
jgi:hypothetical protein